MSRPSAVCVVLAALTATGCGAGQATEEDPGAPLAGAWQLSSGIGPDGPIEAPATHRITLVFEGHRASGVAACNSYGGDVDIDGETIAFGDLAQTEMACEPAVMAAEAAYLGALARVDTLRADGDELALTGPSIELTFEPLPPVQARPLLDTEWELDTLVVGETASSALAPAATLRLAADGTLGGGTGCRSFSGRYSIRGDEIVVARLAVADPVPAGVCAESMIGQERLVLDVLGERFRAEVDGDRLTLTGRDGRALVYRARSR